jgi:hypothetical protein
MLKGLANPLEIGATQLRLQNVKLLPNLIIDEVTLISTGLAIDLSDGANVAVSAGETHVRALLTETNLNQALIGMLPADLPVKGIKISILSRGLKATARFLNMPITMEGTPRVENGVRVVIAWKAATLLGISLPAQLVENLEQRLNRTVDLASLPIPVWLDEIVCEPGRITAAGKVKLKWPLDQLGQPASPFSLQRAPLIIAPNPSDFEDGEDPEPPAISA